MNWEEIDDSVILWIILRFFGCNMNIIVIYVVKINLRGSKSRSLVLRLF